MTVGTGAALAAVYPRLVAQATAVLRQYGLDTQGAEDLVTGAVERWLQARKRHRGHLRAHKVALRSEQELAAWLGTTMRRMAMDMGRRPGTDVMGQAPLSLDEPWARGG